MAGRTLVAGVDSSTQSTKVQVRDAHTGELRGQASAPHPPTAPPRSEQDPQAWWQAFMHCWAALGEPEVAAISIAGQQHGMVALDERRQVIRPAKLWNDTETAPDAGWLLKQLGGPAWWAERTGSVPRASFTASKLSWLHRSEPESWARLAHVLLPHDWLTLQLTGELITDRGDASGTGYWSPRDGSYCADILGVIDGGRDWSTVLPRICSPGERAGTWRGALVAAGTGDNMAAALGLALRPGIAALSIGTSGVASTVSETPIADATGDVACFADATGLHLPLVCTLNAAKVLDTVGRLLGLSADQLADAASAADAGPLTVLPYFDGERTPDRPHASGWIRGLRSDTTAAQLARAAVDAVACNLADGLDALRRHAPVERVVLTGGGARNRALTGVLAGLLGNDAEVVSSSLDESVAGGACVQAAACLLDTPWNEIADRWGLTATSPVEPLPVDGELRARYAELADLTAPRDDRPPR